MLEPRIVAREFRNRSSGSALRSWTREPRRLLYVAVFVIIALLLGARPIGLALDDYRYLDYFEQADWYHFLETLKLTDYSWILEEPLWQLVTHALSSFLDPDTSFRLMIFVSVGLYAWSFRRAPAAALLFVPFAFLVCPSLFAQVYFNQLRQGLAISLFLALLSLGWRMYPIGAAISGLVHTSQLALLPIVAKSSRGVAIHIAIGAAAFAALALGVFPFSVHDVELGRRGDIYGFEGALNVRFFIVALPLYFGILGAIWFEHIRLRRELEPIFYQTVVFCFIAFAASAIFDAAGRLFYLFDALVIWNVCRFWRGRVPLAGWTWASAQLVIGWYVSYVDGFAPDTPWGRVEALLNAI